MSFVRGRGSHSNGLVHSGNYIQPTYRWRIRPSLHPHLETTRGQIILFLRGQKTNAFHNTLSPKWGTFSIPEASSVSSQFQMLSFSAPADLQVTPQRWQQGIFHFAVHLLFFFKLFTSHHIKRTSEFKVCFSCFCRPEEKKPRAHLFLSYAKCRNSSRILKHMSNRIKWVNSRLLISCMRGTALREVWSFGIVLHRSQLIGTLHNAVRGSGCYRLLLRE